MSRQHKGRAERSAGIVKVPFREVGQVLTQNATGFHYYYADLTSNTLGNRVAAMQGLFKRWRYSKPLKMKTVMDTTSVAFWANDNSTPSDNTVGNQGLVHALSFLGSPSATLSANPSTINDLMQMVKADFQPSQLPCKLTVGMQALREARTLDWALTFVTSDTVLFTADGVIGCVFVAFNTQQGWPEGYPVSVWLDIQGELEFCDPVDLAISRAPRAITEDDDEKSKSSYAHVASPAPVRSQVLPTLSKPALMRR